MRCPKCHYLSFDPEPRCKNCGYDLEVAEAEMALSVFEASEDGGPDLPLRPAAPSAAPVTLELIRPVEAPSPVAPAPAPRPAPVALEPAPPADLIPVEASAVVPVAAPAATAPLIIASRFASAAAVLEPVAEPPRRVPARAPHTTTEMPLFVKDINAPRPPLSVRRGSPELPKAPPRVERRVGPLDHDLLEDLRRFEHEEAMHARVEARALADAAADAEASLVVPASQRFGAAALDGLLMSGIGTFVLWGTLRLLRVGPSELTTASLVPLAAFLAAVGVAYLLMFTAAGGQTVGKMLMGIRVVGDGDGGEALTLGQAAGRAVLAPVSVAVLGLGWLPAFFGRGLALHDRLAHTRVVRA